MSSRGLRFVLAVCLLTGLSVAALSPGPPAEASSHNGSTCLFFPWLPNGTTLSHPSWVDAAGPFYGTITVQNLEPESVDIYFMSTDRCQDADLGGETEFWMQPFETRTFDPADIGITPGTGGGVVVAGRKDSNQEPARIAAVQRQVSPEPSVTNSTGYWNVSTDGYIGIPEAHVGDHAILPIAQTNSNWNTVIRATNFHETDTEEMSLVLYAADGGGPLGVYFASAGPGETATFDLLDLGVPEEWIGYARIGSGETIAAVAERFKVETNMLIMNVSRMDDQTAPSQAASLVFRDWFHWNTGISIVNLDNEPNDIDITFYTADGSIAHTNALTIPASSMDFLYLPASPEGEEDPFVGSAFIQGTGPFHGAVDEVKYFGGEGDTGHAMSYSVDDVVAEPGEALVFPVIRKGQPSGGGETSGIQIYNMSYTSAKIEVYFYGHSGNSVSDAKITKILGPHESYTAYTPEIEALEAGFTGSAAVVNTAPAIVEGEVATIAAVSNLVNYDVQFDGSASFNGRYSSALPFVCPTC